MRSSTLSLARFDRKKVPVPGVFKRASSLASNQSTSKSAFGVLLARGSYQGRCVLKSLSSTDLG